MNVRTSMTPDRWAQLLLAAGAVIAAASVSAVALAVFWPLPSPSAFVGGGGSLPQLSDQRADTTELAAAIGRRRLLEPAEIQAAVKDAGAAQDLLGRMRLQGVVQMGDQPQAYVMIQDEGVKVLRVGDQVLGFQVEKIEAGKVELSLEGVRVMLTH